MIEATEELYLSCSRTLEKACYSAWRKNPIIQLDDYRSYANEVFMDATKTFDGTKGAKFNSWLTTQLMRLIPYPRNFKMTTSSKQDSSSLVLSLDEASEMLEGKPCTLSDLKFPINDSYAKNLSEVPTHSNWFEKLKPYLGEFGQDEKTMMTDILNGDTDKKDEFGVPVAIRGKSKYAGLTPRQLYIRLYARKGWSLERVKTTRNKVERIICKMFPDYNSKHTYEKTEQVQEELF